MYGMFSSFISAPVTESIDVWMVVRMDAASGSSWPNSA